MGSYAMITGATGGLGKAFAVECAARGWDLFLTDVSQEALSALADGIRRLYGVRVRCAPCDLTDAAARAALWARIEAEGVAFHLLANVAGLDYQGPFEERQVGELHTMLRLNVEATVEMTRRVLAHKAPERPLHIVNVSSLAAFYPMPIKAVYAASKRFLLDWSLALGQELAGSGVTVTALCPAGMPTTPLTIRAIEAQGFMGRATTRNASDVAAQTVRAALRGRRVVIPGAINQALRLAGSMVPPGLLAAAINRRWQGSHAKSHGVPVLAAAGRNSPLIPADTSYRRPFSHQWGRRENLARGITRARFPSPRSEATVGEGLGVRVQEVRLAE